MIKKLMLGLALLPMLSFGSCSSPAPSTPNDQLTTQEKVARFARVLGDALLQTKGTEYLVKKIPQLMPLLDTNQNGVLELKELENVQSLDETQLVVLLINIEEVVKQLKK